MVNAIIYSCSQSVLNVYVPDLLSLNSATDLFYGENLALNILYNLGFQITDVVNLIFFDPSDTDPLWYTVFFKIGDFMIRFIYRDETLN